MKNNTKLIMETWRRFLSEGPEGIGSDGMVLDPDEDIDASDLSPVEDSDLAGDIKKIDQEMDMYGDPAMQTGSAPMLDAPAAGDDYMSYDEEEEEYYASRGGRPEPGEDTADETMPPDFDTGSFDDEDEAAFHERFSGDDDVYDSQEAGIENLDTDYYRK